MSAAFIAITSIVFYIMLRSFTDLTKKAALLTSGYLIAALYVQMKYFSISVEPELYSLSKSVSL